MTTGNRANDEARIRAVIGDWAKAICAKDVDGAMSHYGADLAPPLISATADAKGVKAWFATWEGTIGYAIREVNIMVGDDAAFCHSLNRLSGTKDDGEKADIWFRQTLCFRKVGGEWRICIGMNPCPSTWTAAIARRSTSSRSV